MVQPFWLSVFARLSFSCCSNSHAFHHSDAPLRRGCGLGDGRPQLGPPWCSGAGARSVAGGAPQTRQSRERNHERNHCGTCYPMSIASYKSKCSKKNECGHCGGIWCPSKCVIGAADASNKCGTAYPTGISSDPHCAEDKENCKSCKGEWCRAGYNSNFVLVEGSHGREVPEYIPPEDETLGTCCYRGKTDSEDMCGTCQDVAKGSTCSVKSRCAGCGGTWCPGPRCVKAFGDEKNPCHSAFPVTGIAKADDFCSLNEKQCSNCKGAWCPVANITYSDGTKYDPSHPYVPDSDQRLEPEDPKVTQEAEEEVAHDEGIDDLFPDGLARV